MKPKNKLPIFAIIGGIVVVVGLGVLTGNVQISNASADTDNAHGHTDTANAHSHLTTNKNNEHANVGSEEHIGGKEGFHSNTHCVANDNNDKGSVCHTNENDG